MSSLDRKKMGFWYAMGHLDAIQLIGIEGVFALLVGIPGSLILNHIDKVADRINVAADYLSIVGALLGVVFAAFALVIAFLSDSYILQLRKNPKGVSAFFVPFTVNIGVEVGLVIGVVAYKAAANHLTRVYEQAYFVVISVMFIYALLNVMALARNVMAHGVTRAEMAEIEKLEQDVKSQNGRPIE
ncbi:MAG: hypothetical protein M3Y33_00215 [Actinomycetota bacterium]|nr:hypothetical protein [Actinomycetota bacterium]